MLAARDSHQLDILAMQWLSRLHAFLQYDIQCPGSASASLAKHDWDASYAMLNKDGKEKVLEKVKGGPSTAAARGLGARTYASWMTNSQNFLW